MVKDGSFELRNIVKLLDILQVFVYQKSFLMWLD